MSAKIGKKAKQKKDTLSAGARESNAGDDFHILWAMRRAVRLLDPSSDLTRVLVEKVSPQDELRQRADKDLFLGVDLSGSQKRRPQDLYTLTMGARSFSRPLAWSRRN